MENKWKHKALKASSFRWPDSLREATRACLRVFDTFDPALLEGRVAGPGVRTRADSRRTRQPLQGAFWSETNPG
jgi:hypothetical protein